MILEEGKTYTNEELAEWFQVKPATFTKAKKKKLEYLKYFAEFEETKCKVKITKVYESNYISMVQRMLLKKHPCNYIKLAQDE